MKLILITLLLAVAVGFAFKGRWSRVASLGVRWPLVALVGLALQLAPVPGRVLPMVLLMISFALLIAFGVANVWRRVPGFAPILIGIVLNLLVISVNGGMPVTRHALVASHQTGTLTELVRDGGAKHHLAGASDHLVFLGDAIAIGPVGQAISVGDVFVFAGVFWLIVAGMTGATLGRRREPERTRARTSEEAWHAG